MQAVMQDLLKSLTPVQDALQTFSESGAESRGAIFTRREVVDFILDLAGYTSDLPLKNTRLLEPSVGAGDFLIPAIDRLIDSLAEERAVELLKNAIRAIEIHRASWKTTRDKVETHLESRGFSPHEARKLAAHWVIHDDFLLTELAGDFTHVVGNPPYVRQELIPDALIQEYRVRFRTIYDRADLYVPFIEKSLASLAPEGSLCLICSDRWMKNRYGAPLRKYIAEGFHLAAYVDMVNTNAFHSDVIAYPAITLIRRNQGTDTRVAHRPKVNSATLSPLASGLLGKIPRTDISLVRQVAKGSAPWMMQAGGSVALVRRLENSFPALEETGCKVGIGVATGADKIFVGNYESLPVEAECKLPLAVTRDIRSGTVEWTGQGVINPFQENGHLVDLANFPRLSAYLKRHEDPIRSRNCAKRSATWYRTIDRIIPSLAQRQKLLIPDIKGDAHIVFENGNLYPHHNLYYITSDGWDLHALQALLLSGIARLFVTAYSVEMAGGFLRFQAQYLRRIRLPHWQDLSNSTRKALITAGRERNLPAAAKIVADIYAFTTVERNLLNKRKD